MSTGSMTDKGIIVGNYYDKYNAKNPFEAWLMGRFVKALYGFVDEVAPKSIHEVGCGEGELCIRLHQKGYAVRGSDFSEKVLRRARAAAVEADAEIAFSVRDIYDLDAGDDADLVLCSEVLEHLCEPERALRSLAAAGTGHFLFSVPHEPLWRVLNMARLRYWADLGNTPGHLQHWGYGAFITLLRKYFDVLRVAKPCPWIMALCRARG